LQDALGVHMDAVEEAIPDYVRRSEHYRTVTLLVDPGVIVTGNDPTVVPLELTAVIVVLVPEAPGTTKISVREAATVPSWIRLLPDVYDTVTVLERLLVTATRKFPPDSLPTSTPRMLAQPAVATIRTASNSFFIRPPWKWTGVTLQESGECDGLVFSNYTHARFPDMLTEGNSSINHCVTTL
jgi:hypothetical protein